MRPTLLRIIAATVTLGVGVFVGFLHVARTPSVLNTAVVHTAPPVAVPEPRFIEEDNYPETLGTRPFDIADFIRDHPSAKLARLWQRLGLTRDDSPADYSLGDDCGHCETNIFEYNLDNDAAREVVLQIKEHFQQCYRYLIFKDSRDGDAKFLGHIDVWAKYPPADPVVLVSNGRPWLIVQSTAATGSGLGAWLDTVYEVSNGRVRPVVSYLAKVNQNGGGHLPGRTFVASPLSCEIKGGHAILALSYAVQYSSDLKGDLPLLAKQQKALLIGSVKNGSASIDAVRSEVTPGEFATIYNFDSMGEDDFLKYNHSELRAIALGKNSEKKKWLKEFLRACDNNPIKRELLALLP